MTPEIGNVARWLPTGAAGNVKISRVFVDKDRAQLDNLSRLINGDHRGMVTPGEYTVLYINGVVMMSDTDMERRTNREVVRRAHGNVLIGGLGLGMIVHPIMAKPEVDRVVVVEKLCHIVDLVKPHLMNQPGSNKLEIITDDILTTKKLRPERYYFNTIYFDIWPEISSDNLPQMSTLKRRFTKRLLRQSDPDIWMGCWREGDARSMKRQEDEERRQWRSIWGSVGGELRDRLKAIE